MHTMNETDVKPLWRLPDLMTFLNCSESTARRRIKKDGIPYRMIGGEYRFEEAEVREWFRRQPGHGLPDE